MWGLRIWPSSQTKTGSRAKVGSHGWVCWVDRHLTFCSHEYSSAPFILKPAMCKKRSRDKRKGGKLWQQSWINNSVNSWEFTVMHVSKNNTLIIKSPSSFQAKEVKWNSKGWASLSAPPSYLAPQTAQQHLKLADTFKGDVEIKVSLIPHDEVVISQRQQVQLIWQIWQHAGVTGMADGNRGRAQSLLTCDKEQTNPTNHLKNTNKSLSSQVCVFF